MQSQDGPRGLDVGDGAPQVLFIDALAKRLGMSARTIARRLRAGTFQIPELPRLDHRRRWSSVVVDEWLSREHAPVGRLRILRSR